VVVRCVVAFVVRRGVVVERIVVLVVRRVVVVVVVVRRVVVVVVVVRRVVLGRVTLVGLGRFVGLGFTGLPFGLVRCGRVRRVVVVVVVVALVVAVVNVVVVVVVVIVVVSIVVVVVAMDVVGGSVVVVVRRLVDFVVLTGLVRFGFFGRLLLGRLFVCFLSLSLLSSLAKTSSSEKSRSSKSTAWSFDLLPKFSEYVRLSSGASKNAGAACWISSSNGSKNATSLRSTSGSSAV